MFLIDDVLLAPGKAAYALFQELARKAQDEWLNDDTVKHELQQLYTMLESGRITDKDFEAQECRLLERLEQIARVKFQDKWGDGSEAAPPVLMLPELEAPSQPLLKSVAPLSPVPSDLPTDAPSVPDAALPVPASFAPASFAPAAALAPPPTSASPSPIASSATFASRSPFALPSMAPSPAAAPPAASAPAPPALASAVPAPAPAVSVPLTMGQVIDCALRGLSVLKLRVSSITSVQPVEDGWHVAVELVERRGVPDTNDVLGLYELRLDAVGNVLRYERTQMRRRCDLGR